MWSDARCLYGDAIGAWFLEDLMGRPVSENSKQAVNRATSERIVEQCKQYLALLAEYRSQLKHSD